MAERDGAKKRRDEGWGTTKEFWGGVVAVCLFVEVVTAVIGHFNPPLTTEQTAEKVIRYAVENRTDLSSKGASKGTDAALESESDLRYEMVPVVKGIFSPDRDILRYVSDKILKRARKELRKGMIAATTSIYEQSLQYHIASTEEDQAARAAKAARNLGAIARLNDTEKALAYYRQSVELDPETPEGWRRLGNLLRQTEKMEDSLAAYQNLLTLAERRGDPELKGEACADLKGLYAEREASNEPDELAKRCAKAP